MFLFRPSLLRALPGVVAASLVALPAGADLLATGVPGLPERVEALVAEALDKSPALAAARAEISAARERVAPAGALPDPMLSLSYENDGASISLGVEPMTRLSLMAEQPIPWPGRLGARAKLAAADAEVVEVRLARVRLSVEAAVRRAAARLLEARALQAVTRGQGETWQRIEAVARNRYAAGMGMQQDVLRAQAERTRLLQQARRDETAERVALAELRRLLQRAPAEPVLLSGDLADVLPVAPDAGAQRARAEEESPELALVRRAAARETLAIDLARRDGSPDLVASAGYMNRGSLPLMWAVGLGVSVPIFSSRKQEPRVREAEARLASARAAESDLRTRLMARTEERLALLDQLAEEARLDRESLLVQDRLAVEAALASYGTGTVPFVTVLEAIGTEFSDRRAALARLAGFRTAQADLFELSLEGAAAMNLTAVPAAPAAMNAAGAM
ncbi:MAG TPA: TolC family protein [Thermoanaerobaculia bacterium]|nr:TolC family protein [Thermoanaerobaculia bacterium]